MSRYFCHDHPEILTLETRVLDARPGAVVLEQSPFHPGGGGQLPGAHILNALVYRHFDGALITGAQLNDDLTARIDFDLPGVDNDRLRALEPELNDVIRQDLPVRHAWVPLDHAAPEPGRLRSRSVAPPPTPDGIVRIVEIVGLDRQACGGTHLASTAQSRPIRIVKVDNKGRHNRRVRICLT